MTSLQNTLLIELLAGYNLFMPILKLDADDEEKELVFEIEYQKSLSFEQRWRMMVEESERIARVLIENGQREPIALVKRA